MDFPFYPDLFNEESKRGIVTVMAALPSAKSSYLATTTLGTRP
jgi:hypothetical protein